MSNMLVKATLEHFEAFYAMKCEYSNISWCGYLEIPHKKNLENWYIKQLESTSRTIFFLEDDDIICAYCYLDKIDENTVEFAYGVSEAFSEKGNGTRLAAQVILYLKSLNVDSIISWVSEKNVGSVKMLTKNGFIRTQQSEVRELPLIKNASTFYLWRKQL